MIGKINKQPNDIILDYGCGTGYMANKIGAYGFDVNNYNIFLTKQSYNSEWKLYNKIYFMHSIAHISREYLIVILSKLIKNADIYILTPDKRYLEANKCMGIDPTATHFYKEELENIIFKTHNIVESITVKDNIFIHAKRS